MPAKRSTVLLLPGIHNSGPEHWQSRWEKAHPSFRRIKGQNWKRPVAREWVISLEKAIQKYGPETVLVAHSLGCLQVGLWAAQTKRTVRAAFLVAPPDPNRPEFPSMARGFARLPKRKLRFPSLFIASTSDSYATEHFVKRLAKRWGSDFVCLGDLGHINADSGLQNWPRGFRLLQGLMKKGSSHA